MFVAPEEADDTTVAYESSSSTTVDLSLMGSGFCQMFLFCFPYKYIGVTWRRSSGLMLGLFREVLAQSLAVPCLKKEIASP